MWGIEKFHTQAGAVVNLSSLSAFQVNPDGISYNVCKAAQDHLTRSLARKYTKDGVRINSVNPGYVSVPPTRCCVQCKFAMSVLQNSAPAYAEWQMLPLVSFDSSGA